MTTNKTETFRFATDNGSTTIQAASADEAARAFAASEGFRGVQDLAGLEAHIETFGGYLTVEDVATGEILCHSAR